MKNKKVLLFSFVALLSGSAVTAQTGQWKLAGNSLTGIEKLGSTNNFSLDFITNNVKRMSLTNKGNLKINSDQTSIQFPNPGANPKPMMFIYQSGSVNTSRMVLAYSPEFPDYGIKYNGVDKFDFADGSSTALDVDLTNKRIGVGTNTPKSRVHVFNASSGAVPNALSTLTTESSGANYLSILTPSNAEKGVLFGHPGSAEDGGIIYNSGSPRGFQFRTGGNITRMVLTKEGRLNVGSAADPSIYTLRVDETATEFGLDIADPTQGTDWELFAGSGGLNLFVDGGAGGPKGVFNRFTGAYSALSDERAKTDIKPMADVLGKIKQLKPSSYQYKNVKDQQRYDGFIAQEVSNFFPSLVTHNVEAKRKIDQYLLNYSGFGVIAIKGIQELMKINEEKDARIDTLQKQINNQQKQINELKEIVLKGNQSINTSSALINTELTDASLEQNIPNPFTNTTSVSYNLPQRFAKAMIVVTDAHGKTIKQLNITGSGKGTINIDAAALSAGTYYYSLIVDGRKIDTKQMEHLK